MHHVIIHTYQFIRLYILKKYHDGKKIPIIDEGLIGMAIKALTKNSTAGPNPKGTHLKFFNEFKKIYLSDYKKLGYKKKISVINLSKIFDCMKTDILTNYENNIKLHFITYVKRFVNSSFKESNNKLLEKMTRGGKTVLRKELTKDLYEIKQDLLNNTLNCSKKY